MKQPKLSGRWRAESRRLDLEAATAETDIACLSRHVTSIIAEATELQWRIDTAYAARRKLTQTQQTSVGFQLADMRIALENAFIAISRSTENATQDRWNTIRKSHPELFDVERSIATAPKPAEMLNSSRPIDIAANLPPRLSLALCRLADGQKLTRPEKTSLMMIGLVVEPPGKPALTLIGHKVAQTFLSMKTKKAPQHADV